MVSALLFLLHDSSRALRASACWRSPTDPPWQKGEQLGEEQEEFRGAQTRAGAEIFLEEVLIRLLFGRWQGWLSVLVLCPPLGSFLSGCEDVQGLAPLFVGRVMLEFGSKRQSRVGRECGSEEAVPSAVPLGHLRAHAGAVSPEQKERTGCSWSCLCVQRRVKTPGHAPVPDTEPWSRSEWSQLQSEASLWGRQAAGCAGAEAPLAARSCCAASSTSVSALPGGLNPM